MTAKRARKQKPTKVRPPADLPAPVAVRLKSNSYQPSKAKREEPVKIDAAPEQLVRAGLRLVKIVKDPDA